VARGFTLIELLVVIAIITLLIGILLPSLSKAREQAQKVKTGAMLKSIGEGLELYRNDNESDQAARETSGYPPSALGEDPAVAGTQNIAGAHWLVRHLMGKDLKGYAPRRCVPTALLNPGDPAEEVPWYEIVDGVPRVDRVGPYLPGLKVVRTRDLPKGSETVPGFWGEQAEQQVFVCTFGFPVLYYVADPLQAQKPGANIATYGFDFSDPGIYSIRDNGLFAGQCVGGPDGSCALVGWDFGNGRAHPIEDFGDTDPPVPEDIRNNTKTFPYYILDKSLYDSTYDPAAPSGTVTAAPHRRESFLLITAGKDGLFGTSDDVKNF
jgi:prepilin-type N-terminal cleavage/methylation domain-containing protein